MFKLIKLLSLDHLLLKKEVNKRINKLIDTPFFDRRLDPRNKRFIKEVIKRDGSICRDCGVKITKGELQVTHLIPVFLFPELAFELANGAVKCKNCHRKEPVSDLKRLLRRTREVQEVVAKVESYCKSRVY